MNKIAIKWTILSFLFLLTNSNIVRAQNYPEQNNPPKIVNDYAHVIDGIASLESELVAYNNNTSNQIAVVTISSTDGYEIADYSIGLFNKWHIGQAAKNNGVLILVAIEDRKTYIVTGRGVEEYLPDIICKRIIENEMIPSFKNKDYEQGIRAGIIKIQGYLDGTFKVEAEDITSDNAKEDLNKFSWTRFLIVLFIFIVIMFLFMYIGRNTTYSRGGYSNGGGWGGWGGGWGGGSSGGGGFGGFGGGSSGGGGAGGSW